MCAVFRQLKSRVSGLHLNRLPLLRRCKVSHTNTKYLLQHLAQTNKIPSNVPSLLAGVAKILVALLVRESLIVMDEMKSLNNNSNNISSTSMSGTSGGAGAIQPVHLREAYRRLKERKEIP